jgi:hypothetical protein
MSNMLGPEKPSFERNMMIEDIQETHRALSEPASSASPGPARKWGARRLSAIEIAEGALLADIAVVFQLLIRYLPVGANIVMLLVPVIFAVIVLRRGLYTGIMSLCVALFVVCIVIGPGNVPFMLLETGAGLFLGLTMRHRVRHLLTIASGVAGGGVALWAMLLLLLSVTGGAHTMVRSMQRTYTALTPLIGLLFRLVGLGAFWQHTLLPILNNFMQWGLQHWLLLMLLAAWVICIPLVIAVYLVVNVFLRLLGYQVRPFPGYSLEGWLYELAYRLLKWMPRRALTRLPFLYGLKCEVRRLNIARLRQQRLEKEARKPV